MANDKDSKKGPPALNPYVFTVLLFAFGLWCFYDGWLSSDPDMQKHQLFNQVISAVLIPWAIYDFFKVKRSYKKNRTKDMASAQKDENLEESRTTD